MLGDLVALMAPDSAPIYRLNSRADHWQHCVANGWMARRDQHTWQAMIDFRFIDNPEAISMEIPIGSIIYPISEQGVSKPTPQPPIVPVERSSRYDLLLLPFP